MLIQILAYVTIKYLEAEDNIMFDDHTFIGTNNIEKNIGDYLLSEFLDYNHEHKTLTFNEKLKFFFDLYHKKYGHLVSYSKGETLLNHIAKNLNIGKSTFESYLYDKQMPDDEMKMLLEDFFEIPRGILLFDDDLSENHLSKTFESIRRGYFLLDDYDLFKITECFNDYIKLDDYIWTFIFKYNSLNNDGRKEFKNIIAKKIISIESCVNDLQYVIPIYKMRAYSCSNYFDEKFSNFKKSFKNKKSANSTGYKHKMWCTLKFNLSKFTIEEINEYSFRLYTYASLNYNDWTVLIYYILLRNDSKSVPSKKQKDILNKLNKYFDNPTYNENAWAK